MDRGSFLKRAGAAVVGLAVFRHLPTAEVEAATAELGVIRDSVLTDTFDYQLIASGGLCAPLAPIYAMPSFKELSETNGFSLFAKSFESRPVQASLPQFTAKRGGLGSDAARNLPAPRESGAYGDSAST